MNNIVLALVISVGVTVTAGVGAFLGLAAVKVLDAALTGRSKRVSSSTGGAKAPLIQIVYKDELGQWFERAMTREDPMESWFERAIAREN